MRPNPRNTAGSVSSRLTSHVSRCAAAALLLVLALQSPAAHAERYRVDLILFLNTGAAVTESPLPTQTPNIALALDPSDTDRLRAAGIELVPEENFGLNESWKRLDASPNYQPLLRLAWIQNDPPSERGVDLRLRWGTPYRPMNSDDGNVLYPVDGSVALLLSRYLHLDVDLVYTQSNSAADLSSYRLKERRRMRRNELHYLDSPRLGLLSRVQKAEP